MIHAAAVVQEESGELMKRALECTYEYPKSDFDQVRIEAVQTAAMALRFLVHANCDYHIPKPELGDGISFTSPSFTSPVLTRAKLQPKQKPQLALSRFDFVSNWGEYGVWDWGMQKWEYNGSLDECNGWINKASRQGDNGRMQIFRAEGLYSVNTTVYMGTVDECRVYSVNTTVYMGTVDECRVYIADERT